MKALYSCIALAALAASICIVFPAGAVNPGGYLIFYCNEDSASVYVNSDYKGAIAGGMLDSRWIQHIHRTR